MPGINCLYIEYIVKGTTISLISSFAVDSVLVATMGFQIAKLRKLPKIAFSCSYGKSKLGHDIFRGDFVFVGHKLQNIDHFFCFKTFLSTTWFITLLV